MTMAHPIVYGPAISTYVWSARLAVAEKGVTHELVDVPFGAHREEPHLSRQPFAKVPGFEHDGFALYETQAIMRYVDERFPGTPLQPEDVHAWSRMPPPCTSAVVGPPPARRARHRAGGHCRARLGRDGGVARGAAAARPLPGGDCTQRAVPAARCGAVRPTSVMPQTDEAIWYQLYFQEPGGGNLDEACAKAGIDKISTRLK